MDVDSKGATDHQGGFELSQLFQVGRDRAVGSPVEVHADGVFEKFGIERANPHAERDAAETAFCQPENNSSKEASLVIWNTLRTEHRAPHIT